MTGKPRNRRGAVSGSVMTEEQATSYVKKVRGLQIIVDEYYFYCFLEAAILTEISWSWVISVALNKISWS